MQNITGIFEEILFRNEQSGYCTFLISPSEFYEHTKDGLLICDGLIGFYVKGSPISVDGDWNGEVFHVTKDFIPHKRKEDVIQILEYLTNELTLAQEEKIADAAESDLFSFIQRSDANAVLNGIIRKEKLTNFLIRKITGLREQEAFTKEMLSYGISFDRIDYLIKKGTDRTELLKNPYIPLIFADIHIRFADVIASKICSVDPYNVVRLCGFVIYALISQRNQGDTCCYISKLCSDVNRLLKNSAQPVTIGVGLLWSCLEKIPKIAKVHILNGKPYVYLNELWDAEDDVILGITRLNRNPVSRIPKVNIQEIEQEQGITYRPMQRAAFDLLKTSGIKILTGPPGSGKTAVVKGLISAYRKAIGGEVYLSATTGCAAQVLGAACNDSAETVNRMLQVRPYDNSISGKDLNNPIQAGLIIVDEISMIGLKLFSLLLGAVKTGSILILVGDKDQLQSVECGNVLHDLIQSGMIETCELTEVMRQCGTIPENASRINKGDELLKYDDSFQYFDCENEDKLLEVLMQNCAHNGMGNRDDFQILCPVKKGKAGIWELNSLFQDNRVRNKSTVSITYGKSVYYQGDKIIMTKTDYERGYYNGDIGIIEEILSGDLLVRFEKKKMLLTRSDYHNMQLAYSITVHKSQGNEWKDVHIVLPDKPANMLTRRILYTAVTRAKSKVYLYCINQSYITAIDNIKEKKRITMLAFRIQTECDLSQKRN